MATRREKELARMRAERQAARRAAEAARRKRRNAVIASTVAALLLVGLVAFLQVRGRDEPQASPTASVPSAGAPSAGAPSAGTCTYTPTGEPSRPVQPPPATPVTGPVTATMTTNRGVVAWSLLTDRAPCASSSMISLAAQGFYDKTPCHRLTGGGSLSVLQCGDPTGTGTGGPGYQFAEENLEGASYPRGTVAMAKSSQPGTSGSQFFLVYRDSQLPPDYTPVGRITKGIDVLDRIARGGSTPAGDGKPKTSVTIETLKTSAG